MVELSRDDLFTLEEYSEKRSSFRSGVLDEKKNRGVMVGNHVHLIFENKNTIQYQVQEMLRIEKIFEAKDIQEELDEARNLREEAQKILAKEKKNLDKAEEESKNLIEKAKQQEEARK